MAANKKRASSKEDTAYMLLVLNIIAEETENLCGDVEIILKRHIREQNSLNRSLPGDKTRVTWTAFVEKVSDKHFKRMFRMPMEAFNELCGRLCKKLGEEVFKPERFLLETESR